MSAFLAVDWGTTNRRAYRVESGAVVDEVSDDLGAVRMRGRSYQESINDLRSRLGDLPVLIGGMAGSNIGWQPVPYVTAPARLEDLARELCRMDDRIAIVPGVKYQADARADVMRGEEIQLLGAASSGAIAPSALVCQPGTHSKWAVIESGAIRSFVTAMTGELFALMRDHSLLSSSLTSMAEMGPAFLDGVAEGSRRDLAASLFAIRSASILGLREDSDAASFASGILIGAECAARLGDAPGLPISILAESALGPLYAAALQALGKKATIADSRAAFLAGMITIEELTR